MRKRRNTYNKYNCKENKEIFEKKTDMIDYTEVNDRFVRD